MHMINEQEIEKMIATINPQLDESNSIQTGDTSLEKILKHYLFLQQCIEEITSQFSVTKEEVLYSQYYWLVHFKNQYFAKVGYDAGIEQQVFFLMEHLTSELDGDVDWSLLEEIENQLKTDN